MAQLKVRVGAALDASVSSLFAQLEKLAQRARRNIEKELGAGAKVLAGPYRTSAKQAGDAIEGIAKSGGKVSRTLGKTADDVKSKFAGLKDSVGRALDLRALASAADAELRKIERSAARAALGINKPPPSWWSRFGGAIGIGRRAGLRVPPSVAMAYGYGGAAAQFAGRIGRDVLGGIGVNTDLQSMVAQGTEQQKIAQQISASGFMPGQGGAAGVRVPREDILAEARKVSVDTATPMTEALTALQAFVAKTGDLDTGRHMLGDMAKLARATGSSLEDVSNASAEVSNNLGDVPDKAGVTLQIMRQIAGQGKLGAVEMRDLASQMAKIATASTQFEGGAAKNIPMLGILAQEAKLHGGAASATQAATSVQALATTLTTGATVKHWKRLGLTPFTDEKETQFSSPDKLIMAALKRADETGHGANKEILKQLFPSSQGFRAVAGFQEVYNQAGGGAAGAKAVEDEFKRLADAQLTAEEVNRAFAESMDTAEAKATVFNQKLAESGQALAATLLPAVEALAPAVLQAASDLVSGLKSVMVLLGVDPNADDLARKKRAAEDEAEGNAAISRKVQHLRTVGLSEEQIANELSPDEAQRLVAQEQHRKQLQQAAEERARMLGGAAAAKADQKPSAWLNAIPMIGPLLYAGARGGYEVTGGNKGAADAASLAKAADGQAAAIRNSGDTTAQLLRAIADKLAAIHAKQGQSGGTKKKNGDGSTDADSPTDL